MEIDARDTEQAEQRVREMRAYWGSSYNHVLSSIGNENPLILTDRDMFRLCRVHNLLWNNHPDFRRFCSCDMGRVLQRGWQLADA